MKMHISLSQPELVLEEYTGTHGLYSAAIPDKKGISVVSKICTILGLDTDVSKLHCTLMYSAKSAPPKEKMSVSLDEFEVCWTHVDHWVGHDGKTYLTAQLSSVDLHEEHARLLGLGCKDEFVPYKPHLTLYSDIEITKELQTKIDKVNLWMARNPQTFTLVDQAIADMKD